MASRKPKKAAPKRAAGGKAPAKKASAKKKAATKPVAKVGGKKKAPKKVSSPKKPAKPPGAKKPVKVVSKAVSQSKRPPRNEKPILAKPDKTPKQSLRRPVGAEELKAKIGALASATSQIRSLKRTLNRSFYDIGQILREIETKRLYEVKGYGSFEAFVERELDLGKHMSLRIVRIVQTFLKEAALKAGLERVSAALEALEGDEESGPQAGAGTRIPPHKR